MATLYHNVVGSTAVDNELLAPGANVTGIRSITITNTHASDSANLGLYIQDAPDSAAANTYKILGKTTLPAGATLLLNDTSMLGFDGRKYGLYVQCVSGNTFDIIINT